VICNEIRAWTGFRFRGRRSRRGAVQGSPGQGIRPVRISALLSIKSSFVDAIANQIANLALSSSSCCSPSSKYSTERFPDHPSLVASRVLDVSNARLCIFCSTSTFPLPLPLVVTTLALLYIICAPSALPRGSSPAYRRPQNDSTT